MDFFTSLNSFTTLGIPAIVALIFLDRMGILDKIFPQKISDKREEKRDEVRGEFNGYVKAKLESIEENGKALSSRLSKHLIDEESDVREIRDELTKINFKLGKHGR